MVFLWVSSPVIWVSTSASTQFMLDQVETKLQDTKKEVSLYDSKHEKKFVDTSFLFCMDMVYNRVNCILLVYPMAMCKT